MNLQTFNQKKILYVQHARIFGGSHVSLMGLIKESVRQGNVCLVVGQNENMGLCYTDLGATYIRKRVGLLNNYNGTEESCFKIIKSILMSLYSIFLIIKIVKTFKIDIIHLNSMTLVLYAPFLKLFGMKTVIHVREHLNSDHKFISFLTKKLIRYADFVIFISENEKKYFQDVVNSVVVYNFMDVDENFSKESKPTTSFLILSGVSEIKCSLDILQLLKAIDLKESIQVLHVGALKDYLSPRNEYQMKFRQELNSIDNKFLNYYVSDFQSDILSVLKRADFVIFWTNNPHFPRPVYEAWLCRVGAIVSKNMLGIGDLNKENTYSSDVSKLGFEILINQAIVDRAHNSIKQVEENWKIANMKFGAHNYQKIEEIYLKLM